MTEYQTTPQPPATKYPYIFLKLCEGQIINVENGEVIISLSQFVAPSEASEPGEIENNSTLSSQLSPRPLQIDSEYATSTEESNAQKANDNTPSPPSEQLSQPLLGHEETIKAESTMDESRSLNKRTPRFPNSLTTRPE